MNGYTLYGTLVSLVGMCLTVAVVFLNWHPSPETCMVAAGFALTVAGSAYVRAWEKGKK